MLLSPWRCPPKRCWHCVGTIKLSSPGTRLPKPRLNVRNECLHHPLSSVVFGAHARSRPPSAPSPNARRPIMRPRTGSVKSGSPISAPSRRALSTITSPTIVTHSRSKVSRVRDAFELRPRDCVDSIVPVLNQLRPTESPRGNILSTSHRRMAFNTRLCRSFARQESLHCCAAPEPTRRAQYRGLRR